MLVLIVVIFRMVRIRSRLKSQTIVLSDRFANFYGLFTHGPGQIRGNGWLLLTKDDLIFEMYLPARSLVIPLKSVIHVDTVPAHLGKTGKAGQPLLRITYASEAQKESAAWRVDQVQQWVSSITERLKQPN